MVASDAATLRAIVRQASDLGRKNWRPLLATDLVYKLLAFALLAPLVGGAVRAGIALSGEAVLADVEILRFVLRPAGLLVLLVVAALSLAIVALEQASLMAIGAGAAAGLRVPAIQALSWVAGRIVPVVGLTLRLVGRLLLLAAPFLVALGAVYLGLLREYDINYYLKERPPVFFVAAALVAALVLGLASVLLPRIVSWLLALPLVLFESVPPSRALAESERRIAGARGLAVRALVLWSAGALALSFLLAPLLLALGRALVPLAKDQIDLVLPLMLLLVVLWSAVNVLVSWVNASAFALLLIGLFERSGGSGADALRAVAAEPPRWRLGQRRFSLGRLAVGITLLAIAAGGLGLVLLRGVRGDDRAVVIAHRGAAAYAPENSLASIEKAIEQGADFVEIDVQETADGEIAVVHDSDFMKVAKLPLKVWDARWDELRQIDIGSWFGPEFAGERVAHLRDVLARARGRCRVTIELKYYGHDVQLEQRVIDLVEQAGAADEVIVMSLDSAGVRKVRALRPDWTVGILAAKAAGDLTALDVDFLAVHTGLATRRFVRRAHANGRKVYVWTVNDPVRMFQMLNLGVDGLITDRPDLARTVIARRAGLSSAERLLVGLAFYFGAAAPDLAPAADGA